MNNNNIDLFYFEHCQTSLRYKVIKNFKHPQLGDCQLVREKSSNLNLLSKDKDIISQEEFEAAITVLRSYMSLKTNSSLIQLHAYTYKIVTPKTPQYRFSLFYDYLDQDLEKDISLHQKANDDYKENVLMKLIQDLTGGLVGLAQSGFLEKTDLRPVNVYLYKDMKDMLSFKLFHWLFGLSPFEQVQRGLSYYKYYLSPEEVDGLVNRVEEDPRRNGYLEKTLCFSLGLLVLNMAAANATYERIYRLDMVAFDEKTIEIKKKFMSMRYSEPLCSLVRRMIDKDPMSRPSFNEIFYFSRMGPKKGANSTIIGDDTFSMLSFELSKPISDPRSKQAIPLDSGADNSFELKKAMLSNEGRTLDTRVEGLKNSFKTRLTLLQERISNESIKKGTEEPEAKTLTIVHTARKSSKFRPIDNPEDLATVKRLQPASQADYVSDNEWNTNKLLKAPQQPNEIPKFIQDLEHSILYNQKTNDLKKGLVQILYPDTSVYKGQTKPSDSARHGLGVYYFSNGDIYLGEWVDNKIQGKGVYYFVEGEYYDGKFVNFKRNGTGIYQYNTGNRYEGEWKDDQKSGFGVLLYGSTNETYEGTWSEDDKDGEGIYTFANGDKFVGRWKKGKKSGKGKVLFDDKGVFEGEWMEDYANGYGVLRYENGDIFEGNYEGGVKQGGGIYTHTQEGGSKYAGQWLDDDRTGNGVYYYSNGDKYTGMFIKGKRNGKGEYVYQNGDVYDGEWVNDRKEGVGQFLFQKGGYYQGEWRNNLMEGKGFMMYCNGDNYEGEWEKGVKHGKGIYFWVEGLGFDGVWEKDGMVSEKGCFINKEGIRF